MLATLEFLNICVNIEHLPILRRVMEYVNVEYINMELYESTMYHMEMGGWVDEWMSG